MKPIHIETERLTIRPHEAADFDAYFAYIMDPELQADLGLHGVTDRSSCRETYQWLRENTTFLALIPKDSGRTMGHIALHPPYERLAKDPAFQGKTGYSLSFAIARSERRKGLMSEALSALVEELFAHRNADYLDCEAEHGNLACCALQEKLGFIFWGTDRFDGTELIIQVLKNK